MTDEARCCGSGTCIIDRDGRCWCGQQWDGQKMDQVPWAPAEDHTGGNPARAAAHKPSPEQAQRRPSDEPQKGPVSS
jgi:hypothetical protein